MSRSFNNKQKHEVINDLDRLAANARQTWKQFPTDVLTKAWTTKTNVLKAIIKTKGKNNFKMPHAKDTEDINWEAIFNDWEEENEPSSEEDISSEENNVPSSSEED